MAIDLGGGPKSSDIWVFAIGSGAGVSSTVECLPVVHGGMERNWSNVKTRGLQQCQPCDRSQYLTGQCRSEGNGRPDTFLPFMEDGWTGMIFAIFIKIVKLLPTTLMHAFLRHCMG